MSPVGGILKWCMGDEERSKPRGFVPDESSAFEVDSAAFSVNNMRRVENIEDQIGLVNRGRRGRTQIQAKPLDLHFEPPEFPKTENQRKFLRKALKSNFLFNGLSDAETEQLMSAMQEEHVDQGDLVIVQGDIGDFFYIVEKGKIEYLLDDKSVGFANAGDGFGELALLYDAPRAVTCQAAQTSTLWKVDQKTFRTLLARQTTNRDNEVKDLIDNVKLFQHLEPNDKARFVHAMTTVVYKPKDRIVQKGSVGNVFYIIQEGEVKIHDIGKQNEFEDEIRKKGDFFGERALLTGELRAANVTALTHVKTLAMDRETFEKVVGPLQMLLDMEMRKQFLKAIPLFKRSDLTEPELDQIARLMTEVQYQQGQMLSTAGQTNELNLWIIRHGSLVVSNTSDQEIHHLESGDYFGDKFLAGDVDALGTTNAFVQEALTTWMVRREDVESVIGDIGRLDRESMDVVSKQVVISTDKMQRLTILGKGAYGTVWLIKHEKDAYALKEMSKLQLLDGNQANGVKREKEMLESMHHPFILGMVACFQDPGKVYFVLPIVPGGELFSVLHNQKKRNEGLKNYNAAFYAAGILEALGYFHQRLIAYRDLKLENVLIDAQGYPVIVDLGFAKKVVDKTYTLCGTPEYLAPEIIMSKGHDKAVDYWAFGCLVYELLVGVTPFYRNNSSQLEMFKRIVKCQYVIPSIVDPEAASLFRGGLLTRRPAERLGNLSKGYLDVKAKKWFADSGISFASVLQKKQTAPWTPVVKDPFDSSNFDHYPDTGPVRERSLTPEEQAIFSSF